ncbi:probable glycosyltransferase [Geofilum rubicundum JCM 15548]|uniref:Probable glycosyltransferase n=1 Tax=Geofilum rubicundum JCM 15548 TaxID=1236989 RepID=A0A0E9M141_9BACT|nr:probable glycosyltransferase [Geofilum rubicundum JCM 15548]
MPEVMVLMATGGASNKSLKNIIQKSREDYRAMRGNQVGGIFTLLRKNLSKVGQFLSPKPSEM